MIETGKLIAVCIDNEVDAIATQLNLHVRVTYECRRMRLAVIAVAYSWIEIAYSLGYGDLKRPSFALACARVVQMIATHFDSVNLVHLKHSGRLHRVSVLLSTAPCALSSWLDNSAIPVQAH
jgi:hypothetical protein